MNPLYVTGIELAEFRSFAKLKIELAGAPGVLVVHVSCGLATTCPAVSSTTTVKTAALSTSTVSAPLMTIEL